MGCSQSPFNAAIHSHKRKPALTGDQKIRRARGLGRIGQTSSHRRRRYRSNLHTETRRLGDERRRGTGIQPPRLSRELAAVRMAHPELLGRASAAMSPACSGRRAAGIGLFHFLSPFVSVTPLLRCESVASVPSLLLALLYSLVTRTAATPTVSGFGVLTIRSTTRK